MKKDTLGNILKKLRKEKGMTQQELAEKISKQFHLSVKQDDISRYENDKQEINLDVLKAFRSYFNVSADYLLGLTETKTNDTDIRMICDYIGLSEKAVEMLGNIKDLPNHTFEEIDFVMSHKWVGESPHTFNKILSAFIEQGYLKEIIAVMTDYDTGLYISSDVKKSLIPMFREIIEEQEKGIDNTIIREEYDFLDELDSQTLLHYYEIEEIPKMFIRENFIESKKENDKISKEYAKLFRKYLDNLHKLNSRETSMWEIDYDVKEGDENGDDQETK